VARISKGETILIRSPAGRVGMAAVQLAKRAGATIYATAGPDEKRQLLDGYFRQFYVNFSLLAEDSEVRPIEATLFAWRARERLGAGERSWSEIAPNLRPEELVDGDHFSLMIPPHNEGLARGIERALSEAAALARAAA
jgi:thioesterase domain-containing protein